MIDEIAASEALVGLFRAGVCHWSILVGVARAMSIAGRQRLDIVDFFWRLMNASPPVLDEEQLIVVDDFTGALLGHCPLDQIVRLHGDPEDPEKLSEVVGADAERWKPPASS